MKEIELKFLNIDVEEIKSRLLSLGAKLIYDTMIESYSFLAPGFHSYDSTKKYLRIRKIDDSILLTYKEPAYDSNMKVMEEIEVSVSDYEKTILL